MGAMDATEWIDRCAAKLDELWPRNAGVDVSELTFELWRERRWRLMEPEAAATLWTTFAQPPELLSSQGTKSVPAAFASPAR